MYVPAPGELSVESCLAAFCAKETLKGADAFLCDVCGQAAAAAAASSDLQATNLCVLPEADMEEAEVGNGGARSPMSSAGSGAGGSPSPFSNGGAEASVSTAERLFRAAKILEDLSESVDGRRHLTAPGAGKSKPMSRVASKQLLIDTPPAVLTLHLKRFEQTGDSLALPEAPRGFV
jgi:ubiquitin carboxyl-terminal hydrolase 16/45